MTAPSLTRRSSLAAAAALFLSAGLGRPNPARAQTAHALRVASTMADDVTPVYYAWQTGMYKKAGLDVSMTIAPTGSAVAEAVISGGVDIGKSSLINLFNAHDHGVPIELVAPGAIYETRAPFTEMIVATDSPLKGATDLQGRLVGVPYLNDFNELVTKMWVAKSGGDVNAVRFVEIPNTAETAAVETHRIDAALLQEPQLSQALGSGKTRVLGRPFDAIGDNFMFAAWFARKDFTAAHQADVDTFERVTVEAAAYTNAHPDATADIMSKATKIPLPVFSKMVRVKTATSLEPSMLQPLIDAAAKNGAIPKAFPAGEFIAAAATGSSTAR